MARQIKAILVNPPIAIARLGASSTPMDSFRWIDSPDAHLQTVIAPDWTLDVDLNGGLNPRMPEELLFRDGNAYRPVAPFFELWALVSEGPGDPHWTALTQALFDEAGGTGFTLTVDARNSKAARRARNPDLEFGTFPPVVIGSGDHSPTQLIGTSPMGIARPLIPRDAPGIPLGSVQILRTQNQPTPGSTPWALEVDVEVIRFRFTPAKGIFYGARGSENISENGFAPVEEQNAFLDPGAGWVGTGLTPWVEPADTFDGAETPSQRSMGIVDDTCSALVTVSLNLRGAPQPLIARSSVFVAPPDFAPDRRPFLSLADEINDRVTQSAPALTGADLEAWVRDLFERVYETVSLMNVDNYRAQRAAALEPEGIADQPIAGDQVPDDPQQPRAMGPSDKLRRPNLPISEATSDRPLPISERARERHRDLAEVDDLIDLVKSQNDRISGLVRAPFTVAPNEDGNQSTMQMPPFMRNSNALPLTIANWQYKLLQQWVADVVAGKITVAARSRAAALTVAPAGPLSSARVRSAQARQQQVLRRLGRS
ncbi:MAG TPA: hypothetical protein VGY99_22035 [Candidatus Binataceae bacterium]|jgi:hypothetical protein|nr:hypothetical protein [Candidatus Binataceae bacterium]